jgi:hypothetical protein
MPVALNEAAFVFAHQQHNHFDLSSMVYNQCERIARLELSCNYRHRQNQKVINDRVNQWQRINLIVVTISHQINNHVLHFQSENRKYNFKC